MARQPGELVTEANARARYVRISPPKVRQVAALLRGKHLDEARRILAFTPKAAGREISKVLEAAVANAEHNFQLPQNELMVRVVRADEGPTLKRWRPRALGRAYRIRKRTSHIEVVLERVAPQASTAPAPRRRGARAEEAPKGRAGRRAAAAGQKPAEGRPARGKEPGAEKPKGKE